MGKLYQFGKVIITVYADDHLPPHFHVRTPDGEALVEIATLSILKGSLPASTRKPALEWAEENQTVIAAEWNRINPRFPIA